MQQPKIVFFDIDETLYRKSSDYLPSSVLHAVSGLKARGIIPAIATGRSLCALPEKVRRLAETAGIELFITINGQYNQYQGREIDCHPLNPAEIECFIALFRQYALDYTFVGTKQLACSADSPTIAGALRHIGPYIVDPYYYLQHPVYQLLVYTDAEQEKLLQQQLVGLQQHFHIMRWHPSSVDLLPVTGSKARGIRAVCRALKIDPRETMAFGDGPNDAEMFKTVGFAVAMGDACPELHAVAHYRTGTVEQDGIYHALLTLGVIT